ncbi:MAG TPA: adenylosuccinate synthase [Firmicutes bacterium]|nr:adenylosuccinate synthase [Bacillota bacterium]
MAADIIMGTQWGDEGKGKIVDVFSGDYDVVVRYQGGANAGHTVIIGDTQYILHLLPSGILNPGKMNIIGNGVVLDIDALLAEMEEVRGKGIKITPENLMISENAHIVLSYHKNMDIGKENKREKKIGTTARGIGPAYTDKYSRSGIRVRDILKDDVLEAKIKQNLEEKNFLFKNFYNVEEINACELIDKIKEQREIIRPYIGDAVNKVQAILKEGKKVLFEGAQGALLDIDFGTYPYVTSSNPTVGGALTGIGLSYKQIGKVWGITKAYQTRVGNGPFPTEMEKEVQELTRKVGGEFGATTGRPRGCGWLDLVALKYTAELNGFTDIILTKLDVLSVFEKIKICTKYEYEGEVSDRFISDGEELYKVKPVYEEVDGFKEDITGVRKYTDLPEKAKEYIKFIEDFIKVPVTYISVGPEREQILKK